VASSACLAIRPRQLALALPHQESFARDDFLDGPSNQAALTLLAAWPDWPGRAIMLVGPEGAGKSHLAAIWAEQAGARIASARLLATGDVPASLATDALVLEDVAEGATDEAALFHLLNLARERDAFLLITARTPPATWRLRVPDLASRLKALPVVTVTPPDEHLLRAVMVKLFSDRQIAPDAALLDYLMSRIERSFASVRMAVERLDGEALRRQRPVTRALASELFRGAD